MRENTLSAFTAGLRSLPVALLRPAKSTCLRFAWLIRPSKKRWASLARQTDLILSGIRQNFGCGAACRFSRGVSVCQSYSARSCAARPHIAPASNRVRIARREIVEHKIFLPAVRESATPAPTSCARRVFAAQRLPLSQRAHKCSSHVTGD